MKASLFVTCIIDQLYPQAGVSAVNVLRRLGVEVDFPMDQTCCGQPLYNAGFAKQSRKLAKRVLESFKESEYVVVPSGSCAAMMKVFFPDLFRDDPTLSNQAEALAGKVYEFSQFLNDVVGVDQAVGSQAGTVTYHPSCHLLREMDVKDQPLAVLGRVQGLRVEELPNAETCCGFGGSFAIKFPHISEGMLGDKISNIEATGAETVVSCDMGCLMNIEGALTRKGSSIKVRHLAEILDQAELSPGSD
ncbi:MAG TPA: (Fe-S)-binding protein [Dehalococcoidia bacterium]|nr:(Fe-S)-binding protein [Dehalococcoidia bacterium]